MLALVFVPPFVSVTRYKSRITQVISQAIGRPVRLSSVELRIIPRPSFVITDLTVEEDPAYGAEPVLHANTVTASIRLLPLWWHTQLEISRISVDEASLNLVRSGDRWNFDSLFQSAARAQTGPTNGRTVPFPYLEATDSRVNIKNGVEKLPYSLLNADLSFWEESPGDWRVRLKGQPARTDVSLNLADTGIVRLEGRMRRAADLRRMPVHFDVEWREAQLGQLSRLALGNDQGWRGDLTGELHVDGTADAAQVTTRLRASNVHRAEFAPASPIDFDATCSFVSHYSDRGLEKLLCESPIGNGRARLTGELPGNGANPRLTVELDRIPAQLWLDMLRTVRNGLDPTLQAEGTMSGRMTYSPADAAPPAATGKPGPKSAKTRAPAPGPISGSISISALRISGDGLNREISLPKVAVEPARDQAAALVAVLPVPAGASAPLNLIATLTLNGYRAEIHGSAALPRLRELARVFGLSDASMLEQIVGPPAVLDLAADGPWLQPPTPPTQDLGDRSSAGNLGPTPILVSGASDHIVGTVSLRNATWKPDFLAGPVEIPNAILHMDESSARWDPVAFTYGPVRGSATLTVPANCVAAEKCAPAFAIDFGSVDAAVLQTAILGARKPGTLLSSLLSRLRPGSTPAWPQLEGTVRATALVLGPVTLKDAQASLAIKPDRAEIRSFNAGLMGGNVHLAGNVSPGDKPNYKLNGEFEQLDAAEFGRLLGMNCSGNPIKGTGEVELAGFTDRDLADSARGTLHFDWRRGAIGAGHTAEAPPVLARFDRWTADAEIANGAVTLKKNEVQRGVRKQSVQGSVTFGDSPNVTFGLPEDTRAAAGNAKQ